VSALAIRDRPFAVVLAGAGILTAAICFLYAQSYFFLFDDFVLIGETAGDRVARLLVRPLVDFYRPLVFVQLKAESALFGWQYPNGYLTFSHFFHFANAGLVYLICRRLFGGGLPALAAAAIFAASPWSSETLFWLSARFDVLSTTGTLAAIWLCLVAADGAPSRLVAAGTAIATAVAVFSKESGVVTPVLCVVVLLAAGRPDFRRPPAATCLVLTAAVVVLYLLMRQRVLAGLGGAYGDVGLLFSKADPAGNVWSYVRSFAWLPAPDGWLGTTGRWIMAAGWILLVGHAVRSHPRVVLAAAFGFLAAIAPVAWTALPEGTSIDGRYVYLSALIPAILAAAAIATQPGSGRAGPSDLNRLVVLTMLVVCVGSLVYQQRLWRRATALSRAGIDAFRPLVDSGTDAVFLPDAPASFREGPYVLKRYSFEYYFAGRRVPAVRAQFMEVAVRDGMVIFVSWLDDPAVRGPAAGERVVPLALPIAGIPR
jgi:hypothetical protein